MKAKAPGDNFRVISAQDWVHLVLHPSRKWHAPPLRNSPFLAVLAVQRFCVILPASRHPRKFFAVTKACLISGVGAVESALP